MAYKLTHPETGDTLEADAQYVAMYESQGWEKAPTAKAPDADASKKK